jgi:hypothetical protein
MIDGFLVITIKLYLWTISAEMRIVLNNLIFLGAHLQCIQEEHLAEYKKPVRLSKRIRIRT